MKHSRARGEQIQIKHKDVEVIVELVRVWVEGIDYKDMNKEKERIRFRKRSTKIAAQTTQSEKES